MRELLTKALEVDGFSVDAADSLTTASRFLSDTLYDAILLDIMLPGEDGRDLLRDIRARQDPTPVILVTCRDAVHDRVDGLRLGADDYVIKPFVMEELAARLKAVIRRHTRQCTLTYKSITIDPRARQARCNGQNCDLSPREYDLLFTLAQARGHPIDRRTLMQRAWSIEHDPGTNIVEVLISRIRRKLKQLEGPEIRTRRGKGYYVYTPE